MFMLIRTLLLVALFLWALTTVDDITAVVERQIVEVSNGRVGR